MKKILFIAYQYPPQGGPGVHRSVRFVNNLKGSGYEPIVLTRDIQSIQDSKVQIDQSITNNSGIKVVRHPSNEFIRLKKFLFKTKLYGIVWFVFYKRFWEASVSWSKSVYHTAKKEIEANSIKVIYTTSAPFSVLFLGNKLKKNLNVKWVADLRDPWTDAFTWQWPSKMHWRFDRKREIRVLNKADKIIVVTNEMKNLLLEMGVGTEEKIHVIYNGYE